MVTSGRFCFMSENQLDSYYHLELLMSLVGETKPLTKHPKADCTAAQGWGSWGTAEHWQMHFKIFCQ